MKSDAVENVTCACLEFWDSHHPECPRTRSANLPIINENRCDTTLPLHERAKHAFTSSDPTLVEDLSDALAATEEALAACQSQAGGRIRVLETSLRAAVEVIKTWHNMDGSHDVWDIYYRDAPEMAPIRSILGWVGP